MDDYDFLAKIQKRHREFRRLLPEVTPEEAEQLKRQYPKDTPDAYQQINPAEFFDGAL